MKCLHNIFVKQVKVLSQISIIKVVAFCKKNHPKTIIWIPEDIRHTLTVLLYFELQVLNTNSQTTAGKLNIVIFQNALKGKCELVINSWQHTYAQPPDKPNPRLRWIINN